MTPPTLEPVNLLVVDDKPENLVALKAILESPEYRIVGAGSGPEALKVLLREEFAAILLDVVMPGMDGFELASLIRQRERLRHIPILFFTGLSSDPPSVSKGYSVGAVDYLQKPLDPIVVRAKVAVFVDFFRKNEQMKRYAESVRESERRERETAIWKLTRESQARYQNLAEAIPQIVWTARLDGGIEYLNQRWRETTGRDLSQSVDFGWLEAVHPDDLDRARAGWLEAVRSHVALQMEIRLRTADDAGHRWHLCRALPERDADGRILSWIGTFTDTDDQKRADEQRADLLARETDALAAAEGAIRARDEFLSVASHELKTPLTPLRLQIQSILREWRKREEAGTDPANDEGLETAIVSKLGVAERQVERLSRLINDLLDVSRITTGGMHVEPESLDLAALAQDVVARFGEEIERAGCSLVVHASSPVVGRWDRLRLEQVITNLLSNGIKYGTGKPVEIEVRQSGEVATLSVRDFGIGVPPEQAERIFERFARAVPVRTYGGLGLGLYIARQIVAAHAGTIRVTSQIGEGATFLVELPLAGPPAARTPSHPISQPMPVLSADAFESVQEDSDGDPEKRRRAGGNGR